MLCVCCSSFILSSEFSLLELDILPLCHFLRCLGVLRGTFPSVCDSFRSKVSLSDWVTRWDKSLLFSLGPFVFYSGCFVRFLLDIPWFSSLFLYPGFKLFLRLFACIRSTLFLLRMSFPPSFLCFSFRSTFLDCCFCFSCPLPFFGIPPWNSLRFPSLVWGFSLPGLSPSP